MPIPLYQKNFPTLGCEAAKPGISALTELFEKWASSQRLLPELGCTPEASPPSSLVTLAVQEWSPGQLAFSFHQG